MSGGGLLARDAAVLVACFLAAILSFRSGADVQLHRSWSVTIDTAAYDNGLYADESEELPAPIVTDLDGDGLVDVVVATAGGTIQLLDTSVLDSAFADVTDDGFRALPVKAEATLRSKVRVTSGRRPVAMAAGFLEHERAEPGAPAREQVLVVLTESWAVICLNASLHVLWESVVAHAELEPLLFFREAAITVAPWPLELGARGVILVAGRLAPRAAVAEEGLAGLRAREAAREAAEGAAGVPFVQDAGAAGAEAGKLAYRYFALDGGTGALHWSHEPEVELRVPDPGTAEGAGRAGLRLDAHALALEAGVEWRGHGARGGTGGGGAGGRDWRLFKASVLQQLAPELRWRRRADTRLRLAHFEKEKRRAARPTAAEASRSAAERAAGAFLFRHAAPSLAQPAAAAAGGGGVASEVAGAAIAAERAYERSPNVLVCLGADGLDVLHLYTGRRLTHVPLVAALGSGGGAAADGSTATHHRIHADINGDSVLDHVYAVGTDPEEAAAAAALGWAAPGGGDGGADEAEAEAEEGGGPNGTAAGSVAASALLAVDGRGCVGVATTGVPTRHVLWQSSVCGRLGSGSSSASGSRAMRDAAGGARGTAGLSGGAPSRRSTADLAMRAMSSQVAAVVAPLTVPRVLAGERASGRDTLFLASTGRVSSVGPTGALNWYRPTGAWWAAGQLTQHVGGPEVESVFPSLERLPAGPADPIGAELVVATGARTLVVLSAAGEPFCSVELPSAPVGSPIGADFTNDGVADLVVPLRTMVVGFRVVRRAGSLALKLLFGTLVAVVAILAVRFHAGAAGTGGPARSAVSARAFKRSTD